jgi:hypothetical protein
LVWKFSSTGMRPRVGLEAGIFEVQLVDIALAADGVEQRVAGDLLLALQVGDHGAVGQLFHALHSSPRRMVTRLSRRW